MPPPEVVVVVVVVVPPAGVVVSPAAGVVVPPELVSVVVVAVVEPAAGAGSPPQATANEDKSAVTERRTKIRFMVLNLRWMSQCANSQRLLRNSDRTCGVRYRGVSLSVKRSNGYA